MVDTNRTIRVLLAKPGLDGHDRGIKILARGLMEAGMEVVYTGLHMEVPQIVAAALQEDVDVIGLSILSGVHMTIVPEVLHGLKEQGAQDKKVIVGGFIPEEDDRRQLEALGADKVFPQDIPLKEIVESVHRIVG
jgi:methylmalonyl-CoA mutase C-terminal domain/subunit